MVMYFNCFLFSDGGYVSLPKPNNLHLAQETKGYDSTDMDTQSPGDDDTDQLVAEDPQLPSLSFINLGFGTEDKQTLNNTDDSAGKDATTIDMNMVSDADQISPDVGYSPSTQFSPGPLFIPAPQSPGSESSIGPHSRQGPELKPKPQVKPKPQKIPSPEISPAPEISPLPPNIPKLELSPASHASTDPRLSTDSVTSVSSYELSPDDVTNPRQRGTFVYDNVPLVNNRDSDATDRSSFNPYSNVDNSENGSVSGDYIVPRSPGMPDNPYDTPRMRRSSNPYDTPRTENLHDPEYHNSMSSVDEENPTDGAKTEDWVKFGDNRQSVA